MPVVVIIIIEILFVMYRAVWLGAVTEPVHIHRCARILVKELDVVVGILEERNSLTFHYWQAFAGWEKLR